jgi:Protein of unknown function (DUF4236)
MVEWFLVLSILAAPLGRGSEAEGPVVLFKIFLGGSMGWNWRKSFNFGPVRINLSKRGFGYSLGARGFRIGQDAKGQNYTQTSIPGTGIYRRDYSGVPSGRRNWSLILAAGAFLLLVLLKFLFK